MSAEFPKTSLVPIGDIVVGEYLTTNSRGDDLGDVEGLAMSIAADGLLSPLIVVAATKKSGRRVFHLVAGQRRLAAIKLLRKDIQGAFAKVPVLRYDGDVAGAMVANLAENLQREDPDPMAVAKAVKALADNAGLSVADISERLGKSRPWVHDRIRLAEGADTAVGKAVQDGQLSGTAGVEILRAPEESQGEILDDAMAGGATVQAVRDAKALADAEGNRPPPTLAETDDVVTDSGKSDGPKHRTVSARPSLQLLRQTRDDFESMAAKTEKKEVRRETVVEVLSWVLGQADAPVL